MKEDLTTNPKREREIGFRLYMYSSKRVGHTSIWAVDGCEITLRSMKKQIQSYIRKYPFSRPVAGWLSQPFLHQLNHFHNVSLGVIKSSHRLHQSLKHALARLHRDGRLDVDLTVDADKVPRVFGRQRHLLHLHVTHHRILYAESISR